MTLERPGEADLVLVGSAVSALRRGTGAPWTASAARTSTGEVVVALGLKDFVCAEAAVVAGVLARGARVDTLVTVTHLTDDATKVGPPCPSCRALLQKHAGSARVLHLSEGLRVSRVGALP